MLVDQLLVFSRQLGSDLVEGGGRVGGREEGRKGKKQEIVAEADLTGCSPLSLLVRLRGATGRARMWSSIANTRGPVFALYYSIIRIIYVDV